jgi:hypothetical protein
MKLASFAIFPFMLFRLSRAFHVKSSVLFKFYINPQNQEINQNLENQINSYYFNREKDQKSFLNDFYDFRALSIRSNNINKIINKTGFFENFKNIISYSYNHFFEKKDDFISKKNETQIQNNFYSKFEGIFAKKDFLWQNNDSNFLDSLKNKFVFYDEFDFFFLVLGSVLLRKKAKFIKKIWTRK